MVRCLRPSILLAFRALLNGVLGCCPALFGGPGVLGALMGVVGSVTLTGVAAGGLDAGVAGDAALALFLSTVVRMPVSVWRLWTPDVAAPANGGAAGLAAVEVEVLGTPAPLVRLVLATPILADRRLPGVPLEDGADGGGGAVPT